MIISTACDILFTNQLPDGLSLIYVCVLCSTIITVVVGDYNADKINESCHSKRSPEAVRPGTTEIACWCLIFPEAFPKLCIIS
ncbi:hypothetical protein BDQ12DRAFT_685736 [Crucibulum laeve]|uniref:Uncharacterized protein n=1 Tax=Crucibulum laeve TaxID=68775 RepID=A0A5C3LXC1_9AGAR|nr:hypothetical protein BDQ12DRAFT_685736 [Crucibulum laeve]